MHGVRGVRGVRGMRGVHGVRVNGLDGDTATRQVSSVPVPALLVRASTPFELPALTSYANAPFF